MGADTLEVVAEFFVKASLGIYRAYREVAVLALSDVPCYDHKGLCHGILVPYYFCHCSFITHYELVGVHAFVIPWQVLWLVFKWPTFGL